MACGDHLSFVLFNTSNTQRVAVRADGDKVLITKEWRKSSHGYWTMGKGISFERDDLIELGEILSCNDDIELEDLLSYYELILEDNTNDNKERSRW